MVSTRGWRHSTVRVALALVCAAATLMAAGAAAEATVVLSSGYVTPDTGDFTTQFTYRVKYWNTGGVLPDAVKVAIWSEGSGTSWYTMWELDPSDTDPTNGKWYTMKAYLSPVAHAYRFAADTASSWVYWPQPGGSYASGPTVTVDLTGRWLGVIQPYGAIGTLLTQHNGRVTGFVRGWPIQYGKYESGALTLQFMEDGNRMLEAVLAPSGTGLSGTVTYYDASGPIPLAYGGQRMSTVPKIPDLSVPTVVGVTVGPTDSGDGGVVRNGAEVTIEWSKPCNGWDLQIKGMIGGSLEIVAGDDLVDETGVYWNATGTVVTLPLRSDITLDAGETFNLYLEQNYNPDWQDEIEPDWYDAYGIVAWEGRDDVYQTTFTTTAN